MFVDGIANVFDPEDIECLRVAFERSWQALNFRFAEGNSPEAHALREELAHCIVEIAQQGTKDPAELSNLALGRLPPYASYWTSRAYKTESQ